MFTTYQLVLIRIPQATTCSASCAATSIGLHLLAMTSPNFFCFDEALGFWGAKKKVTCCNYHYQTLPS
jgi:hypothetical protein